MIDWAELETEDEIRPGVLALAEALTAVKCLACKGEGCMDCFWSGSEAERQFGD